MLFYFFFPNKLCNRDDIFARLLGDATGFISGRVKMLLFVMQLKVAKCWIKKKKVNKIAEGRYF